MTIQQRNLTALLAIFPGFTKSQDVEIHQRVERRGYMPLVFERIDGGFGNATYSLAHYFRQNGDAMRDPEVTFEVIGDGIYSTSITQDPVGRYQEFSVNSAAGRRCDDFLGEWLRNLRDQGLAAEVANV